jgi:hypothetical protein
MLLINSCIKVFDLILNFLLEHVPSFTGNWNYIGFIIKKISTKSLKRKKSVGLSVGTLAFSNHLDW